MGEHQIEALFAGYLLFGLVGLMATIPDCLSGDTGSIPVPTAKECRRKALLRF